MATRKVTVTLDEDVYHQIRQRTTNVSAALNDGARWWLALERQRSLVRALDQELAEQGRTSPEAEEHLADAFFQELVGATHRADTSGPR